MPFRSTQRTTIQTVPFCKTSNGNVFLSCTVPSCRTAPFGFHAVCGVDLWLVEMPILIYVVSIVFDRSWNASIDRVH